MLTPRIDRNDPTLDTCQKSFKRFLQESWLELEVQYAKGNMYPQHENDVVCYLYYALARRFNAKGFPLHWIKTEDTYNLKKGALRPDLNLGDRVFVEVKMYPLREYNSGWKRKQEGIEYTVGKLKQYVAYEKKNSRNLVRQPVIAVWFRHRRGELGNQPFISDSLNLKLELERQRINKEATLLFGPRRS